MWKKLFVTERFRDSHARSGASGYQRHQCAGAVSDPADQQDAEPGDGEVDFSVVRELRTREQVV